MADLHHVGRRQGHRRAADLLDTFDLVDAAGQMAATYSGGMRRRLDLAMTLIGDPRIIFLDEPTTGLDPRSRRTMWRIIRQLAAEGVTIFLTTQNLEEADQLAHRIAVLDRGKVVAEGTPTELKRRIPGGHARLYFRDITELDSADQVFDDASRDNDALVLQVEIDDTPRSVMALLAELERLELHVERFTVHTPDLDDVFFAMTGNRQPGRDGPS